MNIQTVCLQHFWSHTSSLSVNADADVQVLRDYRPGKQKWIDPFWIPTLTDRKIILVKTDSLKGTQLV